MKEDAIQMLAEPTQASWFEPDDTQPVISRTGLSEMLVEPLRQAPEEPMALSWAQEEPAGGIYDNFSLLEENSLAIVNVTREYPFEFAMIMFGYIMPFVLVITLITNSLVIVVLSQRHMRTPTNLVLMTMAMVDIGTMASPSPWYLYIYTFGNHDKYLYPPVICYAHYVMTDVIPIFLHTSSIWLALLLASQRYIYVCHPTLARTWCTKPRVKKAIYTILLVAFLHQSTHFFDQKFHPTRVFQNGRRQEACRNEMASWVSDLGDDYYYFTYFTFRIFFVFAIPCVLLCTLNVLLFKALRRAEKKRTELLKRKFKLVGVQGVESQHGAANSQLAHRRANNFGAYDPSSYTLAARFATERDRSEGCVTGLAKSHLQPAGGGVKDDPSFESMSELSERVKARKSRSQSVDLEAADSRHLSRSSTKDEDEEDESKVDDESTCAECAALRHQRDSRPCRRCSADETETTTARERFRQRQQPGSQCSSITAGATNEEDVSSLSTNQHRRCSDGSIFGHSEVADRRSSNSDEEAELNLSLNSATSGERPALAAKLESSQRDSAKLGKELVLQKADEIELIKGSSSAESRLANCGCLLAHTKALRRVRILSKSRSKGESCCPGLSFTAKDPKGAKVRLWERAGSRPAASQPSICTTPGVNVVHELDKLADPHGATLASANDRRPHSIRSLLQVRAESQQQETTSSDCNKRLFAPTSRHTKSPSFASSMGRASRASLAGSGAVAAAPLALAPTVASQQQASRTMDSNRTTLMLIVVVTVFLIVEVPVAIVTIMHVVISSFRILENMDIYSKLNYAKLFTNFFIMISYSINFTIYCSMSKKFRETFRDLFFWGKWKQTRSARMMYQTQAQPNEFATCTQGPAGLGEGATTFGSHQPLVSPTSFAPGAQLAEGRLTIAHQRSNSLKPLKAARRTDAPGRLNGRLAASGERQQCTGATYSDYLATATATSTLTTLHRHGSTGGQQAPSSNGGRPPDNNSISSPPSSASISSGDPRAAPNSVRARRLSSPTSITSTAAAMKQHCKSMLNGGQPALSGWPKCQL